MYLAFLVVGGKYLIYQTNDAIYVGFETITKDVFNKVITKGSNHVIKIPKYVIKKYFKLYF